MIKSKEKDTKSYPWAKIDLRVGLSYPYRHEGGEGKCQKSAKSYPWSRIHLRVGLSLKKLLKMMFQIAKYYPQILLPCRRELDYRIQRNNCGEVQFVELPTA